jgi:hypothetical protein
MRNEHRATKGDYNEQDPQDVLTTLERNVDRYVELVSSINPHQWVRTASRLPA